MEVRHARVDEKEALARLFVRSRNEMDYLPPMPDEHLGLIADDLFARHEEVWVAEEDGRLLGFLAIRQVKLTDGEHNSEREPDALYRWP